MLSSIISYSLKYRWFVLLLTLLICLLGIYNFQNLTIDAIPDITNVQVQINTEALGYSPLEVEQRITFPIEISMSGLPHLSYTRSLSRYGLSQVTVVFKEGTDIYFARQLINERLQEARTKLPPKINPILGPISTGLGEIFMYTVANKPGLNKPHNPTELRTIQDWIIRPQLRQVEGVADVNSVGGFIKQFHVTAEPIKLARLNLDLNTIVSALSHNNANRGAGYIERNGEQYLTRSIGQVTNMDDIKRIVITSNSGVPIRIDDVATVSLGKELRTGAATENGKEVVLGTVFMLVGENSRTVSERVMQKLNAINATLPQGVEAKPVYNRSNLVKATIHTVKNNLLEGALLVCVVLFLLLGNFRAALITAFVIPLSMLLTITGMVTDNISASLMSLGALDFGLIVDGAVIIVENCIKKLGENQARFKRNLSLNERLQITQEATEEVIRPSVFGVLIITIVYIPILSLTGVEGKMFIPMAQTVVMALLASLLFCLSFVPAAIGIFLRGPFQEKENMLMNFFHAAYKSALRFCLKMRILVISCATLLVLLSLLIGSNIGGEFVPNLDEGDITLHALRIPGTNLTQAIKMQHLLENRIKQFPEVLRIFSKLGTAEIATDPMPPSVADTFIMLKPRNEWPNPIKPRASLVRELEEAVQQIPGNNYEFTQPIQMRFNELLSGVRTDVAVKIFGDKMEILEAKAEEIAKVITPIKGASDVKVEQSTGLPVLTLLPDRKALARYGLMINDVQDAFETAIAGKKSGELFEGDKRFDIVVRLSEFLRDKVNFLDYILIPLPEQSKERHFIPLAEVSTLDLSIGPNQISRENGKRRVVVTANVRGRDLSSFINEGMLAIQEKVKLPSGYWINWGGQFEQLELAKKRLELVVPLTLVGIFLLLFLALHSVKNTILVFTGIPLALTGGILALWLRDIPFSISTAVGFIALSGISVLNGVVMITFINKLQNQQGQSLMDAIFNGSLARLRAVLMTALVAAVGFIPMALATGTGSEVQRPLATVVIGGIISSSFLTLLVLPGLYYLFHHKKQR
ncbi:MAG: CusA/CzcA family heavy metal efflux RND transporter [Tatlockia sp.]|nr:CusA/CzcA family heavy metal efflux RND transporter [Tatlockia sp.]